MNRDQVLGVSREVGTAVGAALVTFGVTQSSTVELILGVLLALISLVFAIKANDGKDIVLTLMRKVLSGFAGALTAYGVLTPEKAEAITAVLLVVLSAGWSFQSNGNGSPPTGGTSPLWVFALLAVFLFPSCATSYKKTTFPDGTVTEERNQTVDATAFAAGANAVTAIAAPKGRIHVEK